MKSKVKISGLDCPNCARNLQNEINKLQGVENAEIDFLKETLVFESQNCDKAIDNIIHLTKKLEPEAKIIKNKNNNNENSKKMLIFDIISLIIGISLGIILFFVSMPSWLFWVLYSISILALGWKTYYKAAILLTKGKINENLLVTISVVGASIVSQHMEGVMVIALYSIGKLLEGLAVGKSRRSIEALTKIQPEYATIIDENGLLTQVEPEDVEIGSITIVKPGEKVAIDGIIIEGESEFNMQSLTGESMPVKLSSGQEILSGAIAINGAVKIRTTSSYSNSTISKIMQLVEKAESNKSKTETFISKLTKYYTLGVIALALIVWGIVWAVTKDFNSAIYRGLIFLVISCPCAFAISVPLAYFSGLGNASKKGVLIKGSNFLDACAKIKLLAFDKTGTLTTGQFNIEKISITCDGITEDEILSIAACGEQYSTHPIAKAIVEEAKSRKIVDFEMVTIENFKEISGNGIEFDLKNQHYFVGRKSKEADGTIVEVFSEENKIGEIALSDTIKPTSLTACNGLKKLGIKTLMLSGDNSSSVEKVANILSIDESYAKLLPQDKFDLIEKFKKDGSNIGYVGDGINDAPSLSRADVGFSMGINGSAASIEASDVVLVDDNPEKLVSAIKISRFTRKIVLENIIASAVVKVVFLVLGSVGVTGMLSAVFADVGVTLLAILNSLRALKHKT